MALRDECHGRRYDEGGGGIRRVRVHLNILSREGVSNSAKLTMGCQTVGDAY